MNKEIIEKLQSFLTEIEILKKLSLFAIIKRADSELWDIVIGGEGLDNHENLVEIIKMAQKKFEKNEIILFSHIVLLNSSDEFIKSFGQAFHADHSVIEIQNSVINNILIKHAYLFLSK